MNEAIIPDDSGWVPYWDFTKEALEFQRKNYISGLTWHMSDIRNKQYKVVDVSDIFILLPSDIPTLFAAKDGLVDVFVDAARANIYEISQTSFNGSSKELFAEVSIERVRQVSQENNWAQVQYDESIDELRLALGCGDNPHSCFHHNRDRNVDFIEFISTSAKGILPIMWFDFF